MYDRSERACRWNVAHTIDRKQRMEQFSIPWCVFSRSHLTSDSIYFILYQHLIDNTHQPHRSVSVSPSLISGLGIIALAIAVAQTPPSHSTKRRRLYGLNSRFDRMLQEVSWASHTQKSLLPHRKHANLLSTADRHLPKIPTGAPDEVVYGSRKLQRYFVPATPENQLSEAMSWRSARLSPPQVVKTGDQDQVLYNPPNRHLRIGNLSSHPRSSWNPPRSYRSGCTTP